MSGLLENLEIGVKLKFDFLVLLAKQLPIIFIFVNYNMY